MRGWSGTGTSRWVNRHAIATLPLWPGPRHTATHSNTLKLHTDTHTTHMDTQIIFSPPHLPSRFRATGLQTRQNLTNYFCKNYFPLTFEADWVWNGSRSLHRDGQVVLTSRSRPNRSCQRECKCSCSIECSCWAARYFQEFSTRTWSLLFVSCWAICQVGDDCWIPNYATD